MAISPMGADANMRREGGTAPSHDAAAVDSSPEVVRLLLAQGE